jgi:2-polyprenyl-6-methoxyphenol hydroxylase-like FAD-dependent oxidoreductase
MNALPSQQQTAACVIVGSGPAGAVLGLLLARQGIQVRLLEMHADFDRDFRGDTLHPSVLEVMDEIGLADRLVELAYAKISELSAPTGDGQIQLADLHRLKTRFPFIAMMPQTRFLDFITQEACLYPNFSLTFNANVHELIEENGIVRGVRYQGPDGWNEVRALVTVGADGRFSKVRKLAGFEAVQTAPPMDVLWLRMPKRTAEAGGIMGRFGSGALLIMLDRGSQWQVGYLIRKGSYKKLQAAGIEAFRRSIAQLAPELSGEIDELKDWKQVSFLSVSSDRLKRWYKPGLLPIGDAAHVMSPAGGNGINYAIMDAVAAANQLTGPLRKGNVPVASLAAVQRRRMLPTRVVQAVVGRVQDQVIDRALDPSVIFQVPWLFRAPVVRHIPLIKNFPAHFIGYGIRREHVKYRKVPNILA